MAIDFSSVRSVLSAIGKLMDLPVPPNPPIPTPLILLSVPKRTGLSAKRIAADVISRAAEAGVPQGPLPSGADNPSEIMEVIRMEALIDALTTKAIIQVAIPAGTAVTATGTNAGGPMQVLGYTTSVTQGWAIIS